MCISHLESFTDAPEQYQALCTKASQHISRALEEVLEPSNAVSSNTEEHSVPCLMNVSGEDANVQPWIAELDLLNSEVFDNLDISTWANGLDNTWSIGGWANF